MQNKGAIISLAVIITVLCLFYLSFTLVSESIKTDATKYATGADGKVNDLKKQKYFDSLRNKPVYNLLITEFTSREVFENELHLGLDLQGGMHVVLEVSPVDIIRVMAGNSTDENFNKALNTAKQRQKDSQASFTQLFFEEYEKLAGKGQLSKLFATSANRGRIEFKTPEEEVKKIVEMEVNDAIDRAYNIIKTRIDKFGVTQPNIQRIPGTGRIQIELPGVDNPERVRKLLQGVAKLEFWEVWNARDYVPVLQKVNEYLVQKGKTSIKSTAQDSDLSKIAADTTVLKDADKKTDSLSTTKDTTKSLEEQLAQTANTTANTTATQPTDAAGKTSDLFSKLVQINQGGVDLVYETADTASINNIFANKGVKGVIGNGMQFMWTVKPVLEKDGKQYFQLYPVKKNKRGEAPLTGEVITDARQGFDERGRPDVSMRMDSRGAREWKKLTGKNINEQVAIVLDNYVYSAPVVQNEIGGGNSSISGNFDVDEAKDLANILKAGKLPAPTNIVEEAVVGPSLGKEAIAQGLNSILLGLLAVVLFMIFYYARAGVISVVALLINTFFIVGVLAQFKASLTLPGIAGIVLTIGMAVDANVLIFERIREELRAGAKLTEAIRLGYDKAFWTIFDSNLTTLITGIFLLIFGTGPISGFAITLIIGILSSFFTAFYVAKIITLEIVARKGDDSKLNFATGATMNVMTNTNYDFLGKRKIAYAFSIGITILGIIVIFTKGLNFGVDFKGGRTYVVEFKQDVISSDVKVALMAGFENTGTEVKTYGSANKVKITTSYLIDEDTDEANTKVLAALKTGLEKYKDLNPQILSSSKVGATVADDIKNSAWQSILSSLVAIFVYILIRFRKWQFGLGAVVSLAHDTLVVISVYALAGLFGFSFEVDQVFVAAILTIIGYSINDTVIVFDRVREYINERKKGEASESLETTINRSINSTLSRTLITSGTTILTVAVLLVFGGEVLRGFAFAMTVGLIFGTYSSVYIASSIVVDSFKKEIPKEEAKPVVTA